MPQLNAPNSYCHKLIRQTARAMAKEVYEVNASDNEFYLKYPDRKRYVAASWGLFIEDAREALAKLLTTGLPESMKDEIAEALVLDNTMRADRATLRWH